MNIFFKEKKTRRVKTPNVLQMEALECGAAALSIILSYYKRFVSLPELRVACGVSRDGSKAINIVKAAKVYGLKCRAFRYDINDLQDIQPPYIVFWSFNHFLVVEGFNKDRVYLNDPALGSRKVTIEEFSENYTGITLTFELEKNFKPGGQKPTFFPALARRLRGQQVALTFLILTGLGLIVPGILLPAFTKIFIDGYLTLQMTEWLYPLVIGLILTSIVRSALAWLQAYFLLRFQMKLSLSSISQFIWHVLRLPMIFFSQRTIGDIVQRTDINNRVADLLSNQLIATVLDLVTVMFFTILMFFYSVPLTITTVSIALLNIIVLKVSSEHQTNVNKSLSLDWGKLYGISMNGISMIETYKATGREQDFFAQWSGQFAKVSNAQQKSGFITQLLETVSAFILNCNNVVVLGFGGYLVMEGNLSIGTLVAFQSLLMSFTQPFTRLISAVNQLQQMHGDMNRLDDVLSYPIEKDRFQNQGQEIESVKNTSTRKILKPKLSGRLELRDVTFGYNRLDPPLITNFSLIIEKGQQIAIVGPSSCGRSTIARLILGLYHPWSGEILFDGEPCKKITRDIFANSVSLIDQKSCLFEGTVAENLTLWDSTIPESDIIQAAKDAEIHILIADRKNGYDSLVQENGKNFSGGERQRLEIARALSINPSLLILDDATSALDAPIEAAIVNNIKKRGLTTLMTSHRLSTFRASDEIIVLDQGKIVQRGTHEILSQDKTGLYNRLVRAV